MLRLGSILFETSSSYCHIYHDVILQKKNITSAYLGCNWFILGGNENFQCVAWMCVYLCVCISMWVYVYRDSEKLAGNQALLALPLTPPLNPPFSVWPGINK